MDEEVVLLSDFVADTITQIINGVVKAQESSAETGAIIVPKAEVVGSQNTNFTIVQKMGNSLECRLATMLEFDLAVTVQSGVSRERKIGITKVIQAGIARGTDASHTSVNRIKFSVPIFLPNQAGRPRPSK